MAKIVKTFIYGILGGLLLASGPMPAFADPALPLQWQTSLGLINLNLKTTETLIGYDGILKQALAGADLPIYTSPLNIVTLKLGADAPWQGNGATVEPMILAGHNLLADIPALAQYPSAQLNIFGRWASESGKAGAGIAFSWAFGTASPQPIAPPAATPVL